MLRVLKDFLRTLSWCERAFSVGSRPQEDHLRLFFFLSRSRAATRRARATAASPRGAAPSRTSSSSSCSTRAGACFPWQTRGPIQTSRSCKLKKERKDGSSSIGRQCMGVANMKYTVAVHLISLTKYYLLFPLLSFSCCIKGLFILRRKSANSMYFLSMSLCFCVFKFAA